MLHFLKRELEAKERSSSVGATFSEKRKQTFDNEVFTTSALFNQGLNSNHKRERRACVFCGLSNHKSRKYLKVTNPSARKEICKKSKNCFICFKIGHNANSCTLEKIINVKTVMANIILVFVLLIKINYNPDLIT